MSERHLIIAVLARYARGLEGPEPDVAELSSPVGLFGSSSSLRRRGYGTSAAGADNIATPTESGVAMLEQDLQRLTLVDTAVHTGGLRGGLPRLRAPARRTNSQAGEKL
jgi:hypothetical protein